ncbi:MAG: GNAT family N-acetyltransferase [Rhodanobacteraceae bacterium]|nr:GNAT family N-acetyltransferase [Rhodanobacteraceae bacterium]
MIEDRFRVEPADWNVDQADLKFVRTEVFILGQQIPEDEEWDELDARSIHVLARDNAGNPIGTGRLTPDDKIGRMAVLESWRGHQVGAAILRTLIERARSQHRSMLDMHAQTHAIPFYRRFGFEPYGEVFIECGIPHQMMRLVLTPPDTSYQPGSQLDATPEPRTIAVETREQATAAVLELLHAAKRELCIYTRDLESALYDQDAVLEALKRIGTAGRGASIRILVQTPAAAVADGHRLIHLAHRLPSVFQFRTPEIEEDLQYPAAFLITDRRGYYFRALGSRFEGEARTYAPGRHAQLREYFDQVWERSLPPPLLRELHL